MTKVFSSIFGEDKHIKAFKVLDKIYTIFVMYMLIKLCKLKFDAFAFIWPLVTGHWLAVCIVQIGDKMIYCVLIGHVCLTHFNS